jgi:S-DNA-T family DNA segregation ATPase FtsK/SpoIIIE
MARTVTQPTGAHLTAIGPAPARPASAGLGSHAAPPPEPIRLPTRPAAPARPGFPVIACVAPLVAAGVIWWITGSALVLVFAVLSPVIAVAGLLDGRRSGSRQRRRDTAEYAAAMAEAGERIDRRLAGLRRDAWSAAPSAHRMLAAAEDPGRWADPASVTVVLGAGTTPSNLRLEGTTDTAEHRQLHERAAVLDPAPLSVDPALGIGLVGPGLVGRALARSLVVQLVGQLSPRLLGVRVPACDDWAWADRLPHRQAPDPARWLVVSESGLTPESPTGQGAGPAGPGEIGIALADTVAGLPPGCGNVVLVRGVSTAEVVRIAGQTVRLPFAPALVAARQVAGLGETLTRAAEAAGLADSTGVLPAQLAFWPLCSARPERRGSTGSAGAGPSTAATSLACVLGQGERGALEVDLAADGPHALVGGTTGSGKSELLVTWVAALAALYPPDQVTFLLVDFKGGAAFDNVEALPHCVGLITDLDELEALRALASLSAELRHRERVLRDAGARDIADPQGAGRLARLVIVVDEFATMLDTFPALHAVFVDIAARGRSLGVHLILCTQRPAGVMRDSLLANCSLRISLRVNNTADSQAVIGTDAAARIPAGLPGRCVVRCGSAAVVTGQIATVDGVDIGRIVDAGPAGPAGQRRPWLDPLPRRVTPQLLATVAAGGATSGLSGLVLGLLDEPAEQRYRLACYNPESDGNLLVLGGAGTGKSTVLASLAGQAPGRLRMVPADVEGTWDALVWARAELDDLDGPVRGPGHRHGSPDCRVLLLDDFDAVLARWGDEHRAAAIDLVTGLLRDNGCAGLRLVITVRRLTGALQALPALCQSRLVLGLPTVHEHQAAGEPVTSFDPALPPGGGRWQGARIQLMLPEKPAEAPNSDRADPTAARVPPAVTAILPTAPMLVVVAGAAARSAAAFRGAGGGTAFPRVVEVGPAGPAGAPGGRLEISQVAAGTVLVGDADTWHAHWSLLTALRGVAPVVFDGAGLADFRLMTRRRDLPPPLAPGRSRGWLLLPDGTVSRVTVP